MTKSGIGTTSIATGSTTNNNNNNNTNTNSMNSTSNSSTMPEIPIWVSDRKKWVTGISKKTTINDIIFAILKQCNIPCDYEQCSNDYVLVEIIYSLNGTTDQSQQQQNFVINSERILKGNTKVYKYLIKWTENANRLMLKVKKCELSTTLPSGGSSSALSSHEDTFGTLNSSSSSASDNVNQDHATTTTGTSSSFTKLLKKFAVNKQNNNNNSNNNSSSNGTLNGNNLKSVMRYVDVKLPSTQSSSLSPTPTPTLLNRTSNRSETPTASVAANQQISNGNKYPSGYNLQQQQQQQQQSQQQQSQLQYKQFDPTVQKSYIITNIIDKDKKLTQQFERVKLLDELIKEAEKSLAQNEYYTTITKPLSSLLQPTSIDVQDIYTCFPEMYTHSTNEVQEFQKMCSKLIDLDDNVQKQKAMLNLLENDIQKELNNSQTNNVLFNNCNTNTTNTNLNDPNFIYESSLSLYDDEQQFLTPETIKLKKEVNLSREQTRIQCKELHDLDLKMRQNETLLAHKENSLKRLLEELYLYELYNETNMLTNNNTNANTNNNSNNSINDTTNNLLFNLNIDNNATAASYDTNLKICDNSDYFTTNSSSSSSAAANNKLKSASSSVNTTQIPITTVNSKSNDQCDNDSGISSMSSENDPNIIKLNSVNATANNAAAMIVNGMVNVNGTSANTYIQIQKQVMETLV